MLGYHKSVLNSHCSQIGEDHFWLYRNHHSSFERHILSLSKKWIFIEFEPDAMPDKRDSIFIKSKKIIFIGKLFCQIDCQMINVVSSNAWYCSSCNGVLNLKHCLLRLKKLIGQIVNGKDTCLIYMIAIRDKNIIE